MDFILVQIAIAFLPGMIWARIEQRYVGNSPRSHTDFFINALVFGLATYSVVYVVYAAFGLEFSLTIQGDGDAATIDLALFADEILVSLPLSLALALLWVYSANHKWLGWIVKRIGASKRYGDEDVWNFAFNSRDAFNEYVHVRDRSSSITIAGWVSAFSDNEGLRELLIRDAQTFDLDTGEMISEAPHLYIARDRSDILIEFPHKKES